eukprot:353986-Chlamydomonas_euryale.AAC.2
MCNIEWELPTDALTVEWKAPTDALTDRPTNHSPERLRALVVPPDREGGGSLPLNAPAHARPGPTHTAKDKGSKSPATSWPQCRAFLDALPAIPVRPCPPQRVPGYMSRGTESGQHPGTPLMPFGHSSASPSIPKHPILNSGATR